MAKKGTKFRYTDEELDEFKQLIEEKLALAKDQLIFYKSQLTELAENEQSKVKGLDDGVTSSANEQTSSLAARTQKYIQHLQNALLRIENKVYGVCRETGKLISKERLKAVPHATLSIEAKQKR